MKILSRTDIMRLWVEQEKKGAIGPMDRAVEFGEEIEAEACRRLEAILELVGVKNVTSQIQRLEQEWMK